MPRSDAAETDAALLHLADVDVAQRADRDKVLAALLVAEGKCAALLERLLDRRVDLVDALVRLERQLAGDVLDADPDLHCGAFPWGSRRQGAAVGGGGRPAYRRPLLPHSQLRLRAACSTCSLLGKPPMPRQASWPMIRAASSRGTRSPRDSQ